jgi:Cof subfamily protein (haloacid dehalogenase superfamily)
VTPRRPLVPRLVATDLDGTLLDGDGKVSGRTRAVLDQLEERGVPVVFVTGRPIRWMDELWDAVGGHGLAICSNGGVVYDVATHTVQRALTIEPDTALDVARRLRRQVPGTYFALEKSGGFAREEGFRGRHQEPLGIPTGPLEQILDNTVVKLLAVHDEIAPETYWRLVDDVVGDLVSVTWSSTFALIEMSAHGVTKASTLERVCVDLGVTAEEVVAFGDMPNDIAMLQWAGTSYAMANAHPSAQAVATATAPSHDDDGVAVVLAELFDLPPTGNP